MVYQKSQIYILILSISLFTPLCDITLIYMIYLKKGEEVAYRF